MFEVTNRLKKDLDCSLFMTCDGYGKSSGPVQMHCHLGEVDKIIGHVLFHAAQRLFALLKKKNARLVQLCVSQEMDENDRHTCGMGDR